MKYDVVALALCLLCAAGLVSCEQPLVGPERKAPFDFPYDSLTGHVYLSYIDDTRALRQYVGFLADVGRQEGQLIAASERAYLRQDHQLWLMEAGAYTGAYDSVYYRYHLFDPVREVFTPDTLYRGIPVGITGNDSIHTVYFRDNPNGRYEVVWLIHDLARKQTHLRQVVVLPPVSSLGYEALGQSAVFAGGQKLLLKTDDRYLLCDGTGASEITLAGGPPFRQQALSVDPAGRTLAYTVQSASGGRNIHTLYFRELESGAEVSYEMPEGSFFTSSAWAPDGGGPRVLLAGFSGLLEVNTQGKILWRITSQYFDRVSWNP